MTDPWATASYQEKLEVIFSTIETYGPLVDAEVWTQEQALDVLRTRCERMMLRIYEPGLVHLIENWATAREDYRKDLERHAQSPTQSIGPVRRRLQRSATWRAFARLCSGLLRESDAGASD